MCLAIPGELISVSGKGDMDRKGKVKFGGVTREVSLAFVPEAVVGDWLIVHVGFALSRLDREEAERTLDLIREAAGDDQLTIEADSPI